MLSQKKIPLSSIHCVHDKSMQTLILCCEVFGASMLGAHLFDGFCSLTIKCKPVALLTKAALTAQRVVGAGVGDGCRQGQGV
jgi:hypothetical protein